MPPDNIFTNTVFRPNTGAKLKGGRLNNLPALDFLSVGTIYNDVYTRGIILYTILTKKGAPPDNIFTNAVLRPNTGAYIGEEGKTQQLTRIIFS